VEVFDTTFSSKDALAARLAATPGGVVGVYTNLMTRANALWVVQEAHRHGWTVVLGGPESANYPEDYLQRGADVVVVGEGEVTMAELLPALRDRGKHRLHGVAGTVFRDEDGAVHWNPEREKVKDIDSLPWPDREAVDTAQYVDVWRTHHGMGSVNLITARGCPYKCDWCSHAVFGYSRRRGAAHHGSLGARPGVVLRRRVHHQPPLDPRVQRRDAAPRAAGAVRDHLARRSHEGRGRGEGARRAGLLPHLDR
jgi:radical SAM superfamily enzyme YgiQ (UPF0313 family)